MNSDDQRPPRGGQRDNPWSKLAPRRERTAPRNAAAEPPRRFSAALRGGERATPRPPAFAAAAPRPAGQQQRHEELRVFGLNACRSAFAQRPQDLRKAYLVQERIPAFKDLLAHCVRQRLGYRVVEAADLAKLTASQHHEGICLEMRRAPLLRPQQLLAALPPAPAPQLLVVLDGVGNPHNFGALLRSAANFGVAGILLPANSDLTLSGAACRVAEGGAEFVPIARAAPDDDVPALLQAAGFVLAATVPRAGVSPYAAALPPRLALVFGAEQEGMSADLMAAAGLRLTIPGSGKVESLNIAASAAVLFAEHHRLHGGA